ncbi:MAG: DNA adenine methylase [Campylobacterota bacterium]|nr:DNA adenine methylase [Campylobacterota bacterium]
MKSNLNLFQSHKFPRTRYQGSKYKLQNWIKSNLEKLDFETALDAFSGTSSIAYIMKEMNKTVYCNDILKFNYYISKALIENNSEQITKDEFDNIIQKKKNHPYSYFIKDTFQDIYFLDKENKWLDIVIQNINQMKNKNKKAMFLWALYQSCISKRPYNLFHRKNLYVRTSDVKRNFGNKTTWDKPFEEHFYKFIKEINSAIFNNYKNNKVYNKDIFDLDIKTDLVYFDTPYIPQKGTLTHYRDFYHFLDGLTNYDNWDKEIDYTSKHKKLKSTYNIWEDKKNIINGFENLIKKFKDSIIVISYRSDGIPTIKEISKILEKYGKTVNVETIDYQYVLSKKQDLKEVLIIGK